MPPPPPVSAADKLSIGLYAGELPYASELFGVYQPLLGWKSARTKKRISDGLSERLRLRHPNPASLTEEQIAPHNIELVASLKLDRGEPFSVRGVMPKARLLDIFRDQRRSPMETSLPKIEGATRHEESKTLLTPYDFIEKQLLVHNSVATEILSPVGILHLFREYFFELPSFLSTPVGHVWVSPGGTLELYEASTRKKTIERTTEYATEISNKAETTSSEQDEVADAVRQENMQDQKLGVTATGSGGIGVVEASASASFSLQNTQKQSQEVTHKRMREQTQKYSTEMRESFKTTFRTVTETTDTSSRRYVLSNTGKDLINYELRRKMRRVAVQIQHLGDQLCWQLFLDNPGKELGIAEFLAPIPDAAKPSEAPGLIDEPEPKVFITEKNFYILSPWAQVVTNQSLGGYEAPNAKGSSGGGYEGFDSYLAPAPPPGYQLQNFNAKGVNTGYVITAQGIDPLGNRFVPTTEGNIGRWSNYDTKPASSAFDITFEYRPTDAYVQFVKTTNASAQSAYNLALGKKEYIDALRDRLKDFNEIRKRERPSDDLRSEERSVVVKKVMDDVFRNIDTGALIWGDADWHIAAEFANRLFDLDRLLYFVSPQWFRRSLIAPVYNIQPSPFDNTQNARPNSQKIDFNDTMDWGSFHSPGDFRGYLVTESTDPAPMGASLGWLIQLDADERRNAFLNSPWVKIVIPIRRGREREALAWLSGTDVEGSDGLKDSYKVQPGDPAGWASKTLEDVLNEMADAMNKEYEDASTPTALDFAGSPNSRKILPTEKVFEHGFDPLDGGLSLGEEAYKVFSQWTEILPTDQVAAVKYETATP